VKRRRRQSAFTLPETLVALALFVLAIGGLAQAANNALRTLEIMDVKEGREQEFAFVRRALLAQSATTDIDTFTQGGTMQTKTGEAQWTAAVEPTTTADLFKVTMGIELPSDGAVEEEKQSNIYYLLRPSWSVADDRSTILQDRKEALAKVRTTQVWP